MFTLRLGLASVVLCWSVASHAADPPFLNAGPDTIPAPSGQAPRLGRQSQPALAFGSGIYFAVWQEERSATETVIYGTRMNPDGTEIDAAPLLLGMGGVGIQQHPAVAFDGTRFVAAWNLNQSALRVVYIAPLTSAAPTTPIPFSPASGQVALAAGASKALLVYQLTGSPNKIMGLQIDNNSLGVFQIASGPGIELPSVAGSGNEYLVAWQTATSGHIAGARVTLSSIPTVTAIAGNLDTDAGTLHNFPTCAFDGTRFLVGWNAKPGTPFEIHARTLDLAVPPTLTADTTVGVSPASHFFRRPQAGAMDGKFVLAWEDNVIPAVGSPAVSTLSGVFVDPTTSAAVGAVTSLSTFAPTDPALLADLQWRAGQLATEGAAAGTRGRLVWSRKWPRSSGEDVVTTGLEMGTLAAASPVDVALGPASQRSVAVASNGSGYFAVWEDGRSVGQSRDQGTDLLGQRFDAAGAKVGAAFVVSQALGDQRYPAVAALPGGDYLVAWVDTRNNLPTPYAYGNADDEATVLQQLFMTRVGADGTVRSPAGVLVDDGVTIRQPRDRFPRIAVDPISRHWLVTWDGDAWDLLDVALQDDNFIGTALISEAGAVESLRLVRLTGKRLCGGVAAFTGTRYLLVADTGCNRETRRGVAFLSDVVGIWVSAAGVPDLTAANLVSFPGKVDAFRMAPTVAALPDGTAGVAWEEYPGMAVMAQPGPGPTGKLAGALVSATGQVTPKDLGVGSPTPRWPRLSAASRGFLLSFIDETMPDAFAARAVRLRADFGLNKADKDPASPGRVPVVSGAFVQPEIVASDPVGASVALDANGQALFAYTAGNTNDFGTFHARRFGVKNAGDACTTAPSCGDGRCERDAESAAAGVCCAVPCSGPCQKCTIDGCVGVPAADTACGTVTCGALSTTCRVYDDAPAACLAFNRCGRSNDLASCTLSHAVNEGGACNLPGCSRAGSCQAGACVCPDANRDYGGRRALPGCSFASGAGGSAPGSLATLLLALGLFALVRRRSRVMLLVFLTISTVTGCADDGALAIDLQFEDGSLQETAYVRLVVKSAAGFSAATLFRDEARDETVRNIDLDRDGTREIVADLGPKFAFNRRTSFLKLTSTGRTPTSVTLSAQGIDRFGNPVAVSDQLVSTLPGGKVTLSLKQCVAADCSGQRQVMVAMPRVLDVGGHAIAALAARGSTAEAPGLVAAGIPTSDGGDALFPNRGRVALLGPVDNDLMLAPAIEGAAAGDLFGAAVALGDVTGDGALDLVVGAPGITVAGAAPAYTAGRIYVIPGVSLATADLSTSLTFDGPTGGERLGSSLTLVDLDGDGVLDILAGAPAGDAGDAKGAVYALSAKTGRVTMLAVARGTTGAHLGGAVDALEGFIGSAAPGASSAYLWTPQELLSGSAPRLWSSQAGGGLGSSVVLCDIGADGTLDALASAPAGAGAIYSVKVPAESKSLGDADISHTITPGQTATAAGEGHLGAVLSRVPTRYGDAFLTTEAGVAYLITAAALDAAGPRLDPIAASAVIAGIQGAKPGAAFTSGVGANILVATPGVELLFGDNGGNLYVYSYAGSL